MNSDRFEKISVLTYVSIFEAIYNKYITMSSLIGKTFLCNYQAKDMDAYFTIIIQY